MKEDVKKLKEDRKNLNKKIKDLEAKEKERVRQERLRTGKIYICPFCKQDRDSNLKYEDGLCDECYPFKKENQGNMLRGYEVVGTQMGYDESPEYILLKKGDKFVYLHMAYCGKCEEYKNIDIVKTTIKKWNRSIW